jgi:hypothetical protein
MVGRRKVVGGGVLAGLAASMTLPEQPAKASERDDDITVARAVDHLREILERQSEGCRLGACAVVDSVRLQQKTFIKANHKFPDYIDVGVDAWCELYDWHVKNRQTITTARLPDGRYGLDFMFTTIVLRPEQTASFDGR